MNPRAAKAKGNLLEDWVVDRLRKSGLDIRAYRQKGSGSGLNKGDIWNDLDIHFECKNVARMQWVETLRQMTRDNVSGLNEVLVWHLPQTSLESTKVVIPWEYFEELLLASRGEKVENPLDVSNLKYRGNQAREAIRLFLKELGE